MAIGGTVINGLQNTEIFYAVPDFGQVIPPNVYCGGRPAANPPAPLPTCAPANQVSDQVSRLYIASAAGVATPAANTRQGRVRTPTPQGNNADAGQGVNDFINAPVAASASTTFGIPGSPVTVNFFAGRPGIAGSGTVVNFLTPTNLGQGSPPDVQIDTTVSPPIVNITLNTNADPTQASGVLTFGPTVTSTINVVAR